MHSARYISYVYFGDQTDSLNDHKTVRDADANASADNEDVSVLEFSEYEILEEYPVKFVYDGYVIVITVE